MTQPKSTPYVKVRVVLPGMTLHLHALEPPRFTVVNGRIVEPVDIDLVDSDGTADTLAFIDWSEVIAVSYRMPTGSRPC